MQFYKMVKIEENVGNVSRSTYVGQWDNILRDENVLFICSCGSGLK